MRTGATGETYEALCGLLAAWIHGAALKPAATDWEELFQIANRHSLAAAVCLALEQSGWMEQCPAEIAQRFREAKLRSLRKTLLMDEERRRLLADMEGSGIWYAPLKGIVLQELYPQFGAREFADNDILFDAQQWRAVRARMEREGYTARTVGKGAHDTYHKPPVYNFEMHRTLFPDDYRGGFLSRCAAYYANVRERLIKDDGNGFGYHFNDEDFYVYLLAHARKHYDVSGCGLRTLLDAYLYRLGKPEMDAARIAAGLEALGIADFEARLRALAEKLFDWPPRPVERADEAEMLDWIESSGTYGTTEHGVRSALQELQRDDSDARWGVRAEYLLRRIFPDMNWYRANAPFAYRHRWAIPFYWTYRLFRGIVLNGRYNLRALRIVCSSEEEPNPLRWLWQRASQPFRKPFARKPLAKRVLLAMRVYEEFEGHSFDLEHPVLFTEKMVWYKLFYEHPDMPRILDKYLFKAYVAEKLGPGHTAQLYGVWTNMRELKRDWEHLPEAFCLKCSCSCASRKVELVNKRTVQRRALFRKVRGWFYPINTEINSAMGVLRDLTPRVLAEELLAGEDGPLRDYKVYCFDGRPDFIGAVEDRFAPGEGGTAYSYYDLSWKRLPVTKKGCPSSEVPRPRHLDEMLRIAEVLSSGFPFMRVDLYETSKGVMVGELTPVSGNHFDQREWDEALGKKFNLPIGGAR